jgi:hypothetical protein
MSKPIENQYAPDVVSPPGETLAETLEATGISQAELARRNRDRPPDASPPICAKRSYTRPIT